MTILRDFELSDREAERIIEDGCVEWNEIDGVYIEKEDTALVIDANQNIWARGWLLVVDGEKND